MWSSAERVLPRISRLLFQKGGGKLGRGLFHGSPKQAGSTGFPLVSRGAAGDCAPM